MITLDELKIAYKRAKSYPEGVNTNSWGTGPMDSTKAIERFSVKCVSKYG